MILTHLKFVCQLDTNLTDLYLDWVRQNIKVTTDYFTFQTSHQLIHAPERPYSCSMCQKSFKHVSHKIRHELMHKGKRHYFDIKDQARNFVQNKIRFWNNISSTYMLKIWKFYWQSIILISAVASSKFLVRHDKNFS